MESRVNYAARPDFGAHVGRLGEAELRRLLRVACPGVPVPGSRSESAELLMTREAAQTAVSAATPDVLEAVKLVHVLEDSAAVEDIAAVAVWGSEADAMPHDGDQPPSNTRVPATTKDVAALMGRAGDLGLAWQEPAGVWNVPPHVSDILVQDATMATPVECLAEFTPRDVLRKRMADLGLLADAEIDEATDDEVLARLRAFYCSPRRVRALVSTAPHAIQKELLLFAREGIFLDESAWGERRAAAVAWAIDHLLGVKFGVPSAFDGVEGRHAEEAPEETSDAAGDAAADESAAAGAGDAADEAAEPDAPRLESPQQPKTEVNASLLSPVALALKLGRTWLPTPHPVEQRPAWIGAEEPGRAATAAVAVATAVMQLWEDGGYLGSGGLHEFAGAVAVHDFAASIGADESVVHEVVGMLAGAGFMNPITGQPTARSAGNWFTADASRRWAWLVAGWLRGPDRWVGEESPEGWMPSPELMATVAARIRREAVQFASELDEGMMWYPCCVESRLGWTCGALFDGLDDMWGMLLSRVMQGMRVLGLMVDGAAGKPARVVADAMVPAWFSGQEPTVDEAVDMVAAEAGELIPVGKRAQLLTPPSLLVTDRLELVAMVRGVPAHDLAVTLDSVADREKCGATSLWVFTEDSLSDALEDYAGDIPAILEEVGSVTAAGPWLRILRHRLHALEEAADLETLLPAHPTDALGAAEGAEGAIAAPGLFRDDEGAAESAGADAERWGGGGIDDPADEPIDEPGAEPVDRVIEQELDLGLDIAPDHTPVYADDVRGGVCADDSGDGARGGGAGEGRSDGVDVDDRFSGDAPAIDESIEPPLFDVADLAERPTATDRAASDPAAADRAATDPAVRESGATGKREDGESEGPSSSKKPEMTNIEDPLRRPDSGSGPGVPIQPPLF
ncbi:hypothetical protein [Corynebacterium xerosis]|uniref:hypothetical protein n=1 Tax=Corynebacterium xerosis TaxID=1725 RepID=UPI0027BAE6E8|nr:hypothetical protein [Corynebacterium xerosis]